MVESTILDNKKQVGEDEDDFESMLTMNTAQQQLRNTKTHSKLLEKANTTGIFDEKMF